MTLPNTEIPAALREIAEKGVKQLQDACTELKSSAEQGTEVLEKAVGTTSQAMLALQTQSLDALKSNINSGFDLMKNLLSAKSPSELIEHCTAYTRQQLDMVMSQSKSVQDLSAKVAVDVAQPAQESVKVVFNRINTVNEANKVA